MLVLSTLIAIICYAVASVWQWRRMKVRNPEGRKVLRTLGIIAFVAHGYAVYKVLHQPDGIDLGIFQVGSLIAWVVVGILLISSMRQKLDNLFIGAFPMGLITVALATFGPDTGSDRFYSGGLVLHILLSLLAYSIFTLASLQAIILARQEVALKQHKTRGFIVSLPPLQVMERLLFEMIGCGFILLSVALISGFMFVDNLFAQHLVHKTVLSIIAWVVYAILLCGRQFLGWRSHTAVRWTIGGFVLLMLAFFGSKIVIEMIMHITL